MPFLLTQFKALFGIDFNVYSKDPDAVKHLLSKLPTLQLTLFNKGATKEFTDYIILKIFLNC